MTFRKTIIPAMFIMTSIPIRSFLPRPPPSVTHALQQAFPSNLSAISSFHGGIVHSITIRLPSFTTSRLASSITTILPLMLVRQHSNSIQHSPAYSRKPANFRQSTTASDDLYTVISYKRSEPKQVKSTMNNKNDDAIEFSSTFFFAFFFFPQRRTYM